MGASIRIEDEAFSDRRYDRLAKEAGLADADHARGKMAVLWRQCTIEQRHELPVEDVSDVLGPRGVDALIAARLGELVGDQVRICGTEGRIEWLGKLRNNGKYGSLGGRPRKPTRVSTEKPTRVRENAIPETPPAPAPAPAPAPSGEGEAPPPVPKPTRVFDSTVDQRRRLGDELWADHRRRYEALRAELKLDVATLAIHGEGRREIAERLLEFSTLQEAEHACRHVLDVLEAEARAKGTLKFFGERLWASTPFANAKGRRVDEDRRVGVRLGPISEGIAEAFPDGLMLGGGERS